MLPEAAGTSRFQVAFCLAESCYRDSEILSKPGRYKLIFGEANFRRAKKVLQAIQMHYQSIIFDGVLHEGNQSCNNVNKLYILLLGICLSVSLVAQEQENNDAGNSAGEFPVLLVFSGSDWCSNCIRFNKEVIQDSSFDQYIANRLIVLKADFPQRKQLPEEVVQQNEQLAEKYNPEGYFPRILLLNSDQTVLSEIPYSRQTSDEFIRQLDKLLPESELKEFKKRVSAMGSFFEFIIVDEQQNEAVAWQTIQECAGEVDRIEQLISEWIDNSQVSMINKNAGISPVQVSPELYRLIERSIQLSKLTQGAFDITFQGLGELWRFDGSQKNPPDSLIIESALQKISYKKIQLLDNSRVFLPEKGMAIGFGGIGQGYAVDKVKELLLAKGITNFVINSSGDVYANGSKADGSAWKVGIADPQDKQEIIRWLEVDGKAVVTSGNYEKYFEYEGHRYAHIIDPKTGWPTQGILSATVISPHTEVADALATALFVLGKDVGLDLVNQLPDTHCIIIDDKKNVSYSRELIPKK